MLGTLAKWLRILGYDTLFQPELNDHQLVRLARAEDRVLLTRDRELARRRGVRVLLVDSAPSAAARCATNHWSPSTGRRPGRACQPMWPARRKHSWSVPPASVSTGAGRTGSAWRTAWLALKGRTASAWAAQDPSLQRTGG